MIKVLCVGRVVKGRLIFEKVLPGKELTDEYSRSY